MDPLQHYSHTAEQQAAGGGAPQHQQPTTMDVAQQQHCHRLLQQQQQSHHNAQQRPTDNTDEVMQQLMILVRETQDTDNMVQKSRDIYQNFVLQVQTRSRYVASIAYAESTAHAPSINIELSKRELANIELALREKASVLDRTRHQLISSHFDIFRRLNALQSRVLYEYLPQWHHEQQLINNDVEKVSTISLDTIQQWIEKILDIIWRIKNQIKGLQLTLTDKPNVQFNTEQLDRFVLEINKNLENLIMSSFVVEKQPPQVMKTNTRFTATVRFLCGNKLNFQLLTPTVKALILSESNARTVIRYHKQLISKSWSQIENNFQPGGAASPSSQVASQSNQQQQLQQQQQQHYQTNLSETNHQSSSSSVSMMDLSPEQPLGEPQSSSTSPMLLQQQHQLFQQHPPPQQQAQFSNVKTTAASNMTAAAAAATVASAAVNSHLLHHHHQQQQHHHHHHHQQQQQQQQQQQDEHVFSSITHIGYNPDVPINSKDFECSGEIINNSNILEFQESTGHMVSQFKNMQLKKIKRTEKKGTESVMDEKFILLFFTNFRVADDSFWPYSIEQSSRVKRGDLFFHILAFSLPVVVIVHGNQDPHAWATITWHNAFATPDELLYRVPDKVTWAQLGHVLSEKFRSSAGRGLSPHNLKCLASKVYRNRVDSDDVLVSWNQFSKEPLSDKSFTFWEWFHSILKLTKDHLKDLWHAERIYGFVGKKGCMDLLLGSAYNKPAPVGTFLLRFSETELGGITIALVSDSSELSALNPQLNDRVQISQRLSPTNTSSNVVMHLQPFLGKDLHTRSLADRIRDLKDLIYLYPNIPKDEAFEAYYTDLSKMNHVSKSGYVPTMLVSTLASNYPRAVVLSAFHSEASVTPNSIPQNSPETYYHGESMSMNEVMESNYAAHYEAHPTVGGFNYSIQ